MQERAQGIADEPSIDIGRNIEFPDLEEATLQQKNPELFAYIHNVEDVIAKLLTGTNSVKQAVKLEH